MGEFYSEVYGRDSIDRRGMELISSVHYGVAFDNAFWNSAQMVYGDGSGRIFQEGAFTRPIDVVAHELTHGVTEFTSGLEYSTQPGALNESFSDVFGSLVKQYSLGQTADEADWLIGEGALVPAMGRALRSMKEPGTANSGDRQPGHMRDYLDLPDDNDPRNDNGGVHINSGIPNRAFYLAATAIGGNAWEKAGRIWYGTLTDRLGRRSSFERRATATRRRGGASRAGRAGRRLDDVRCRRGGAAPARRVALPARGRGSRPRANAALQRGHAAGGHPCADRVGRLASRA